MIHQARFRLTLLYSLIFLLLFWSLSWGVYVWMNGYFGDTERKNFDTYIRQEHILDGDQRIMQETPSDIVMDDLRNVLFILDAILLIAVPTVTWFLTGATLKPVQEAHEREKQFFTDASHDLRTPLTILKGEIDLALKKDQTQKSYRKTLESNEEEVEKLIQLVENMLFFARNGSGTSLKKVVVDIADIVSEKVLTFQKLAKQKHQTLLFSPLKENVFVLGNKALLVRLIQVILDNAVKYTGQKGRIFVSLSREKNDATITIEDSGIGIAEDQQKKVFDRFFRADSSRHEEGYGLGLAIAQQIVQYHKGIITLTSQEERGTTVTISLPLIQNPGRSLS